MAQVDWNSYQERIAQQEARQANGGNEERSNVGFFSLKNDRDEAIVRFVYSDPNEFELIAAHTIRDAQGKWRSISCLRNPKDPMDLCPLCASGDGVRLKFYIKLIEYVKQADGSFVGMPKVWERSASYAQRLASKMATYGPLKDCLFIVRRHGVANSMKTEYDIDFIPEDPAFKKEGFEAFDNFKALGRMVAEKSYEDMLNVTGAPVPVQAANPQQASYQAKTAYQAPASAAVQPAYTAPANNGYVAPATAPVTPAVETAPVAESAPIRTYREPTQPVTAVQGSENVQKPRRQYW